MTSQELQSLWNTTLGAHPISPEQADLWLALHTEEVINLALRATFAKWERENHTMTEQYLLRYASKTMNNAKSRRAGNMQEAAT